MGNPEDPDRWARLRFSIIGPLLAAPPPRGELHQKLLDLSSCRWKHPVNGTDIYFSVATLERWFYAARRAQTRWSHYADSVAAMPAVTRRLTRLTDSGPGSAIPGITKAGPCNCMWTT